MRVNALQVERRFTLHNIMSITYREIRVKSKRKNTRKPIGQNDSK